MNTHSSHTWRIESSHRTSEGLVVYQRCRCGARRVAAAHPDHGISTELPGEPLAVTA
ncbi:hypothetical protein [Nocardia thailandica]